MFDQAVVQHTPVDESERTLERAVEPHLLTQPPVRGALRRLSGTWVAAARIRPQTSRMVLGRRPLLEQHLPCPVEHEHRDRPMQRSGEMSVHLGFCPKLPVVLVDQNHQVFRVDCVAVHNPPASTSQ